jgi:hypothetical protein
MSVEPCPALAAGSLELSGLTPCWVTSGDGYLGTSADASDRIHAARAATKAEFEFALALDPGRVVSTIEAFGEREQLALGQLVEPVPWWTVNATDRRMLGASASRTLRLVRAVAVAIGRLGASPPMPAIEVVSPPSRGMFDARVLADVFDVCKSGDEADPALTDDRDSVPCGPGRALGLGTVGVSLLRPMLVDWPSSQTSASELRGESKQDFGWAVQLLASASAGALFPPRSPVEFFAPSVGFSAGVSYRWGTYLPGRVTDRSWSSTSGSPKRSSTTVGAKPEAILT